MITIATLEDVTNLEILINSAYRGETSKQGWTTEANLLQDKRITVDELVCIIENKEDIILKYTIKNQIIASVFLSNKGSELYLGMLTVSPKSQNNGIGKKLLQEAEVYAKSLGLTKITMTVISIRKELIDWYKRQGYIDTGIRKPFPLNDTDAIIGNQPLEFITLERTL